MDETISPPRDRLLFTPGPLSTSATVKWAMLRDPGSRDADFIALVASIRQRLLDLARVPSSVFTTVLMPGSGTNSVEAVIITAVPPGGRLLVLANGAYGERIARIAEVARIPATVIRTAEDAAPNPVEVSQALAADPSISHVALVHCETAIYGFRYFGQDYGQALARWIERNYVRQARIGAEPFRGEGFGIVLLRRRASTPSAPERP